MRIAIDATAFIGSGPEGGQYRYAVDLVRGLARLGTGDRYLLLGSRRAPPDEIADVFAADRRWTYAALPPATGRGALYREQLRWWGRLRHEGIDLLHALHTFVPLPLARRTVCTIYDLMFEIFPEYAEAVRSRPYRVHRWTVRHMVRHVIAISETTAADLLRLWDVPPDRVSVVPLGSDMTAGSAGVTPTEGADGPLVVSPYNLEPRKNLATLVDAMVEVRRTSPTARLVLFGRAGVTPEREAAFRFRLAVAGMESAVTLTGPLPIDALSGLYRRATVFVFPSLYEGFGLPVLEAMGAGACVVARNASAMAEVVGDAGVLVETREAGALASTITGLLADPGRRASLGARARVRAAEYTVARMAERTSAVYNRLCRSDRP